MRQKNELGFWELLSCLIVVLTGCLLCGVSAWAWDDDVFFYENTNWGGKQMIFSGTDSVGDLTRNQLITSGDSSVNWNDKISSLRLGSNLILTVFEHRNFGGASFSEFGPSDMPNLATSGWNDRISSFKVRKR